MYARCFVVRVGVQPSKSPGPRSSRHFIYAFLPVALSQLCVPKGTNVSGDPPRSRPHVFPIDKPRSSRNLTVPRQLVDKCPADDAYLTSTVNHVSFLSHVPDALSFPWYRVVFAFLAPTGYHYSTFDAG